MTLPTLPDDSPAWLSDLKSGFPEMKGFARRNLQSMQQSAASWIKVQMVQQLVSQILWGHKIAPVQGVQGLTPGGDA